VLKKIDTGFILRAILTLVIVFILLSILAGINGASTTLQSTNPLIFAIAASFFILSILLWLFSWAYLLKKRVNLSYSSLLLTGFCSVFGSLTPVQLGSDALRGFLLKDRFGVSFTKVISASLIVKGIKFLLLALTSSLIFGFFLFEGTLNSTLFYSLLSGFLMVIFATLLFLLPLKKSFGRKIARFFGNFSKVKYLGFCSKVEEFFISYSAYLHRISVSSFAIAFFFAFLSWIAEFLALYFVFDSLSLTIPFSVLLSLFVLVAVLERTPFLPRGIGLIEIIGIVFLSIPVFENFSLSFGEIASIMVLFNIVRLVIPTLLSLIVFLLSSTAKIERKNLYLSKDEKQSHNV